VRGLERLGDLPGDGEGLVEGERPALQPLGEVLALDELHDEGADAARLLEAVDRGDVRVLQLGQDLRLALETRARRSASAANASGRTLIATSRFSFGSVARQTSPMPPSPSLPVIS
jgi:hypothetical protein